MQVSVHLKVAEEFLFVHVKDDYVDDIQQKKKTRKDKSKSMNNIFLCAMSPRLLYFTGGR